MSLALTKSSSGRHTRNGDTLVRVVMKSRYIRDNVRSFVGFLWLSHACLMSARFKYDEAVCYLDGEKLQPVFRLI